MQAKRKVLAALMSASALVGPNSVRTQEIATFDGRLVHIPLVRLGEQVVEDVYLTPVGPTTFAIHSVGPARVTDEAAVARYDAGTGLAEIDYVALPTNTYKNIRLRFSGGQLALTEATPLFENAVTGIATPEEYYPPGNALTLQMVAALDINLDGRKDIAAHYWHNTWDAPDDYYGDVSNSLVVYLQNEDRSFRVGNEEIFGSTLVDLGGSATRKQVVADFNGDGYDDIAYAVNREDGRPYSGHDTNWSSIPVVVMSNGDGTYRVDEVGEYNLWYHAVTAVENDLGTHDLVLRSEMEGRSPAIAYRYFNGEWIEINTYPPLGNWSLMSHENIIFSDEGEFGLVVHKKILGLWQRVAGVNYDNMLSDKVVEVRFQRGDTSGVMHLSYIDFLGLERTAIAFAETCIINDGELFVAQLDGSLLPDDWRQREYVTLDMPADKPFLFYRIVGGELVLDESLMPEQDGHLHGYRFECGDKTGDGLDDIVAFNNDGSMSFYVQSSSGTFEQVDGRIFPSGDYNRTTSGIYQDLNADGILDLVIYSPDITDAFLEPPIRIRWGSSAITNFGVERP